MPWLNCCNSCHFTVSKTNPYRGEIITFNASTSHDSDGYIVNYTWDFGDGNITTIYNTTDTTYWLVNHTYNYAGTYQVSLTVTDNDGLHDTKKLLIPESINVELVHDISIMEVLIPSQVIVREEIVSINITVRNEGDTSESFNVTVSYDETTIETYTVENLEPNDINFTTISWNTTGVSGGTYSLKVQAKLFGETFAFLDDNLKILGPILIQEKPIADFSYTPVNPTVEQVVTLDASASHDPDGYVFSYTWDFGDGNITTVTDPTIVHKYTMAGTYNVNLTITDNNGLTTQKVKQISIVKTASTIVLTLSATTITLGENVTLSGQISSTRAEVMVILFYRSVDESNWHTLTITTNADGQFSYSWRPEEAGTYEVKASWEGDDKTLPNESDVQTLSVKTPPTSISLYSIIETIMIAAVALGLIMLILKKLEST